MTTQIDRNIVRTARRSTRLHRVLLATLALIAVGLHLNVSPASAKEVIAYFGTEAGSGSRGGQFNAPGDIVVNSSGAGPADPGDIYVIDKDNNRVQRFAQDDNGTPANPYDDTYPFVSAWGADVDGSTMGGDDYEICTIPASCTAAVASGGIGAFQASPEGIAIDQDTGNVYVSDKGNNRISVYSGDGVFLRSFGWDVVESGPGNTGTGFEVCVAANGDACKAGAGGAGVGQIGGSGGFAGARGIAVSPPDGNPTTGMVFLADKVNLRVNTYGLDGSSPSSFGSEADLGSSGPVGLVIDLRGIVYIESGSQTSNWVIARYDSQNTNGGGVGFLAPIPIPPLLTSGGSQVNAGLEVGLDPDGAGPATDVLFALRGLSKASGHSGVVQQFGPVNAPSLTTPPSATDVEHGSLASFFTPYGLGFDEGNGRLFVGSRFHIEAEKDQARHGVYVLDTAGSAPAASLDSLSGVTATSVTLHATVEPNGPPPVSYRIEYSTDGVKWTSTPPVPVGIQEAPQSIEAVLSPPPGGLEPNTAYQVRLAVTKLFMPTVTTAALSFATLPAPPVAETVGAPVRSATAAQLNGRVNPRRKAMTYHFEYGDQGPCDVNPCQSTEPVAVASGGVDRLVSAGISGLEPDTTYHYRVIADNGALGSPVMGDDMTVTTSASDAPLSHGHFPGPSGSDRAYEMVSLPDSGGNPVNTDRGFAISSQGDRAVYSIFGGTPISDTGSIAGFYFAERGPSGWETRSISPARNELVGDTWSSLLAGPSDLSTISVKNSGANDTLHTVWRLSAQGAPTRVFDVTPPASLGTPEALVGQTVLTASDSPRVILGLHATGKESSTEHLYDVTSGVPEVVSLLPGDVEPPCDNGPEGAEAARLSRDGRYLVFASRQGGHSCFGPYRLYVRDLLEGESRLISPVPLSGADCGMPKTLRLVAEEFFFWTTDRLSAEDTPAAACASGSPDGDIYRYDLDASALECVTCPLADFDVDVEASTEQGGGTRQIAVAPDGSRIYFRSESATPLVAGASTGDDSTYVLETETKKLRWVGKGIAFGQADRAMTSNGSVVLFSSSSAELIPLGGTSDNGDTSQLYRYDDRDRSLICISCPQNGTAASDSVETETGPSADGGTVGFSTAVALLSSDQNTPPTGQNAERGADVYEWRNGRLFLITDGLTDWPSFSGPRAVGISPSGRDLYFTAFAQYTPDALDAYNRLYDARIGGGFEYPEPPVPCPLEVCQGTPKGAPEEAASGTGAFSGPGNLRPAPVKARCPKGKRRVRRAGKARCVKRRPARSKRAKRNRRAKHERRAQR